MNCPHLPPKLPPRLAQDPAVVYTSVGSTSLHALGGGLLTAGLAQNVASSPNGLDVVLTPAGHEQLLAKFADEDIDDLHFWLVHAPIEVIEEHLFGERRAPAESEQLEDLVLFGCEVDSLATDLHRLGVEVHSEVARLDHRLGVALRAPHNRVDACHKLIFMERLRQIVVG